MSCRIELRPDEHAIAELNMKAGNFKMSLCGLDVRLIRVWSERAAPHPEKITYWAEISRINVP